MPTRPFSCHDWYRVRAAYPRHVAATRVTFWRSAPYRALTTPPRWRRWIAVAAFCSFSCWRCCGTYTRAARPRERVCISSTAAFRRRNALPSTSIRACFCIRVAARFSTCSITYARRTRRYACTCSTVGAPASPVPLRARCTHARTIWAARYSRCHCPSFQLSTITSAAPSAPAAAWRQSLLRKMAFPALKKSRELPKA